MDDDPLYLAGTKAFLNSHGFTVHTAGTGGEALKLVEKLRERIALVILDYKLPDGNGALVTRQILDLAPDLYILIYSGLSSVESVSSSWRAGAVDYIEKGGDPNTFLANINDWCRKYDETTRIALGFDPSCKLSRIIQKAGMAGRSKALADSIRRLRRFKEERRSVLIFGEDGVGKELAARYLNASRGPFISINCRAYTGSIELLESEIFGRETKSTPNNPSKMGLFSAAEKGTILFKNIQHLPLAFQARLLEVMTRKKYRKTGDNREHPVNCALVVTAPAQAERTATTDNFLLELREYLGKSSIRWPSLKERREDIEPLVAHFAANHSLVTGEKRVFLSRTVRYFEDYDWPGNVRELENTTHALLTSTLGPKVLPENLPSKFFAPPTRLGIPTLTELRQKHREDQVAFIKAALATSKNKFHAAKKIGVSPSTLHSMMKRAGMVDKGGPRDEA